MEDVTPALSSITLSLPACGAALSHPERLRLAPAPGGGPCRRLATSSQRVGGPQPPLDSLIFGIFMFFASPRPPAERLLGTRAVPAAGPGRRMLGGGSPRAPRCPRSPGGGPGLPAVLNRPLAPAPRRDRDSGELLEFPGSGGCEARRSIAWVRGSPASPRGCAPAAN